MANKFTDSFNGSAQNGQPNNLFQELGIINQNPAKYMADHGIDIPKQYQSSPETMARYLLSTVSQNQQNGIMQRTNQLMGSFRGMFGF